MEYGFIAGQCQYNEVLQCGEQDKCDRCGWNEAVAAERTKKNTGRNGHHARG